jgi:hypothetical protein
MLEGALSEVLALGDRLRIVMALDRDAIDAALAEVDRKADADRPAADDHHRRMVFS